MRSARPAAALVLAVLGAGCLPELPQPRDRHLVRPPPAPTDIRKTPHTFALGLLTNRRVKTLAVDVFDTGDILTRGESVSALKSYHAKIRLAIPVFLVRHPIEGLILVGAGLSPDRARWESRMWDPLLPGTFRYRQRKGQDILSQLGAAGISSASVRGLILTHLSPESAGMADAFPAAWVGISARELEWGRAREADGKTVGVPLSLIDEKRLRIFDIANSPSFGPFENGFDLFGDGGMFLVSLPGRSPGGMGVWLNLDQGPVLLTGGAAYVIDNYLDLALPVKERINDLQEYWRSLHIIRAAQRDVPQLVVFPGNDLAPLKLYKRADIKKKGMR